MGRRLLAGLIALALVASACSSDSDSADTAPASTSTAAPTSAPAATDATDATETTTGDTDTATSDTTVTSDTGGTEGTDAADTTDPTATTEVALALPDFGDTVPATFRLQPGVHQIAVLGAEPGATLWLAGSDGTVGTGTVDTAGSFLWRGLTDVGGAYTVYAETEPAQAADPVGVMGPDDAPPASSYVSQPDLPAGGFGYITVRDGTTLSANVMLPGPADQGPYPTIVEYSGYQPSDPKSNTFGLLFNTLGFAYVGVNMRGTGCSGGSYQFFEEAQLVDGYDVIEAVAAQPWVANHVVGMGGISYPGISQLFVASTQPPSLAAITPLSVLDDSYRATGEPGGILNTGFAAPFLSERQAEAEPYGQAWTKERADGGDTRCAENQSLRLQNPDFLAVTEAQDFYDPAQADALAPATFVDRVEVPVFLAGAWQDEQTGGHFPDMLDDFTGSPHLYADLTNGLHTDSLSPAIFARMVEFLDLYIGRRTPSLAGARSVAGLLVPQLYGVNDVTLPDDRFTGMSYEDALAEFESEPPFRVLFEQGAAGAEPGAPYPRFVRSFDSWPVAEAEATSWFLGDDGALQAEQPTAGTPDTYTADPTLLPRAFYPGGRSSDIWKAGTQYDWQPLPDGSGVGYTTAPLDADVAAVGGGSLDLWISATAPDTDLEVTVSEVRPDGTEMYVQSGWLRASHRALDEDASTEVRPVQTHLEADAEPLPDGEAVPVRVEIFPFAYVFRAGNQIRVTVDAPGNSRPVWEFDTISAGEEVTVLHDAEHPSKLVLPVVPGIDAPEGVAPCGSLRGQPCRAYVPASNE